MTLHNRFSSIIAAVLVSIGLGATAKGEAQPSIDATLRYVNERLARE